jgi:hypothetical protein
MVCSHTVGAFLIEYLWNAARREPPFENLGIERQGQTINLKKTEHSDSLNIQYSIFNSQDTLKFFCSQRIADRWSKNLTIQ